MKIDTGAADLNARRSVHRVRKIGDWVARTLKLFMGSSRPAGNDADVQFDLAAGGGVGERERPAHAQAQDVHVLYWPAWKWMASSAR